MTEEEILAGLRPACICKGITMRSVIKAINNGAKTFEAVSKVTGIGGGPCKSRRCQEKLRLLLPKTYILQIPLDLPKAPKGH